MSGAYEDSNLAIRKHRLVCFDLGYELQPTLGLITPGVAQTFEIRDLIQRTQAIVDAISNESVSIVASDGDMVPPLLATLSLIERPHKITAYCSSQAASPASSFGKALWESLTSNGTLSIENVSAERSSRDEKWRIYWFSSDDRPKIQGALDFFVNHKDIKGAVFIVGYARSAAGGLLSQTGPRPYRAIENATGLGEIYFL